ncbi:hypothetical protein M404DRAFT_852783 [Pisolithus tinctorius Marx 270]|uniref:Uncharacterized protein n=1 Tax=Pisolithus tinctorius Marx 270 TaxID=870435 RepID=A0A0C3IN62_PISTI|nr:hypothetical protein M404DRAFT_852783 [Pisolithus tinctorius Marx 270]
MLWRTGSYKMVQICPSFSRLLFPQQLLLITIAILVGLSHLLVASHLHTDHNQH